MALWMTLCSLLFAGLSIFEFRHHNWLWFATYVTCLIVTLFLVAVTIRAVDDDRVLELRKRIS